MVGASLEELLLKELHQTVTMFEHEFEQNLCPLVMIIHIWLQHKLYHPS